MVVWCWRVRRFGHGWKWLPEFLMDDDDIGGGDATWKEVLGDDDDDAFGWFKIID